MELFIMAAANKYPVITSVMALMGFIRLVNKPLFAFLHWLVNITPSKKDNMYLGQVERSKTYKTFLFVVDWFVSIKVDPKK